MTRMLAALLAVLSVTGAWAQTPAAGNAIATPPMEESLTPPMPERQCCSVRADTVVALEIIDLLNSSKHKRGDWFQLRVVTPVMMDGVTLIAAGTLGAGQIVHAAAARGGGAPGELLIAARSLDIDGQSIPLRGLKLGVTGGDNSGMALGVSFAAGPFAMFIRGREIEIPAGTLVNARLANDVILAPAESHPTPPISSSQE